MSDVELYLLKFDRNREEATAIATGLGKKELGLLPLIESLGSFLNSDEASTREKTLSFLAEVLETTPTKTLTIQQRNLLCDFLSSRIADEGATLPVTARALLALSALGQWDPAKAADLINNLLQSTHPLSQYRLQSERYPVLQLIDAVLSRYRNVLHDLHDASHDFMTRFVTYFDGEKDPRNLMIVFSILRVPMTEWDIHKHAQELFDAVFNYFPITFRPPPNDPYGITAQDLKDRLRFCIAASADLAPYSFPALLDKLDSTSNNTKRDVIQTMHSCVENYGARTVSLYGVTLWDALKFEILQVQEEDLAGLALGTLAAIAKQLSTEGSGPLTAYLKPIAKEASEHLEDTPTKQSQATGRILEEVSSASPSSANFLSASMLPTLFALFTSANSAPKRRGLIEVLDGLLRANLSVFGEWKSVQSKSQENGLAEHHVQIHELLSNTLVHTPQKEVSLRMAALGALTNLLKARNLLSTQELSKSIQVLVDIILTEEAYGTDDVKIASMKSLVSVAQQVPQLVVDTAFPQFLAKIPDTDPDQPTNYVFVLESFVQMAQEARVFQTIITRLKHKLNTATQLGASPRFIQALLAAMLYTFTHSAVNLEGDATTCPYFEDLVLPLIQKASSADSENSPAFADEGVLELTGKLANVLLRQQTTDFQKTLAANVYSLFRSDRSPSLPFTDTTSTDGKLLTLSTYLLASLRRDVPLPFDVPKTLHALRAFAQSPNSSPRIKQACVDQISLLINKHLQTSELALIADANLNIPDLLADASSTDMRIAFAVTKALLLRNAPRPPLNVQALLHSLASPQGLTIARGFGTLLRPDEVLRKENHCVVSALHKQKLFNLVVADVSQAFPSANPTLKQRYLTALGQLLRHLQYTVIEPHLSALVPLLLQMLDLSDEHEVKAAGISTIVDILWRQPKPLEEHTSSLIARLLACTAVGSAPAGVRSRALQALALVPSALKREAVIPFRRQVIKRLTAALDDRKRDVRAEAVKCRARWIELDDAGDDDD